MTRTTLFAFGLAGLVVSCERTPQFVPETLPLGLTWCMDSSDANELLTRRRFELHDRRKIAVVPRTRAVFDYDAERLGGFAGSTLDAFRGLTMASVSLTFVTGHLTAIEVFVAERDSAKLEGLSRRMVDDMSQALGPHMPVYYVCSGCSSMTGLRWDGRKTIVELATYPALEPTGVTTRVMRFSYSPIDQCRP